MFDRISRWMRDKLTSAPEKAVEPRRALRPGAKRLAIQGAPWWRLEQRVNRARKLAWVWEAEMGRRQRQALAVASNERRGVR